MRTVLVTGGCGFIGSNFVLEHLAGHPGDRVLNLDKLTYAGNAGNLAALGGEPRYEFVRGDIADEPLVDGLFARHGFDSVVNFAAESHVDRSIEEPQVFLRTNVLGTQVLLDAARRHGTRRFVQVSTDEVYGALGPQGRFTEATPLSPRSPYSASKAAADHLCAAYFHTHGLPVTITRCCNNYGRFQFPEKLIPLMILNAMQDRELPVYGDGLQVREWIHVDDHCRAVEAVLERGMPGQVYNVGSGCEMPNIEVVRLILAQLGKPQSLIAHVADRPGHDRRYAVDSTKIRAELDWEPSVAFEQGLAETVRWYRENHSWWESILSGDYRDYYRRMYEER
jgi:dTDP-glucose 4,6-dehydratase